MLKKTITYSDLDGNPVTEDFYFSFNKAEIAEMELSQEGGLSAYLQKIVENENGAEIIAAFKKILLGAVGRRSEDGRRFIKNDEIRAEFEQTEAYSELFMELVTDADASAEFIRGIVPSDLSEQVKDGKVTNMLGLPENTPESKDERPAWLREKRDPTHEELVEMDKEELKLAFEYKQRKDAGIE